MIKYEDINDITNVNDNNVTVKDKKITMFLLIKC